MKTIKYRFLSCEIDHGTVDRPDVERVILDKQVLCEDTDLEETLKIVLTEAENGEYSIENVTGTGEEPTTDDVLNALLGVTE